MPLHHQSGSLLFNSTRQSCLTIQSKRTSKPQRYKSFNEVIDFSVPHSLFTPSALIPQSVFHSPTNDNMFPNHCVEFLTLKFKLSQSSVHHQSITQCLHPLITNLVGCSFHLHSECLHFGASFATHFQYTIFAYLCVSSAFHSVPLLLQSQMCFLSQIRSVNPVSTFFLFVCMCDLSPVILNSISPVFIISPSHNAFTPSSPILLTVVVLW